MHGSDQPSVWSMESSATHRKQLLLKDPLHRASSKATLEMPSIRKCPRNRVQRICLTLRHIRGNCILGNIAFSAIFRTACEGAGNCEHGRRRNQYKGCGSLDMCEHNRRRRECKSCGGLAICEHGRIRSSCKCARRLGHM